jgi:hypothetical protein
MYLNGGTRVYNRNGIKLKGLIDKMMLRYVY